MKILIGTGNTITAVFSAAAKTLAFSGAYNFDIEPSNLQIWNSTRSAFMLGGGASYTATGPVHTNVAGLPVQTITLSDLPASSADADVLVIFVECPNDIALYNATVENA